MRSQKTPAIRIVAEAKSTGSTNKPSAYWKTINSIVQGAHYLMNQMILTANQRPSAKQSDPKVGGHSSASASCIHILGALHLIVRKGYDFIANKPHASPTDHAYHYLLNLLLDKSGCPLTPKEAEKAMGCLRAFPTKENPYVFQSYHSSYDPDHQNFLPSGTVGIPPVVLGYLALAYQFAKQQGYNDLPPSHFWALIGDSEFREGSLFEAIPDLAERQVGSLTWIIDYNRQSLDGHRAGHPSLKTDDKRIENTFLANGWEVIQVRHGQKRLELFKKPNGAEFKRFFENHLSDIELQILLQLSDPKQARAFILKKSPGLKKFLKAISDETLLSAVMDLGGHDTAVLSQALKDSKKDKNKPCAVIAHTIKGWGLKMALDAGNHSLLPSKEELESLKKKINLNDSQKTFSPFKESSPENSFLKKRGEKLLKEINQQKEIKEKNQDQFQTDLKQTLPAELGISLKLIKNPHTQWMLGQWVSKFTRISASPLKDLKDNEKPFHNLAKMFVCLSPDVGTSTNLSFSMDNKVYSPVSWGRESSKFESKKSPNLNPSAGKENRFLRFEIAEAAALSCLAAFGKMKDITGLCFFPLMSVYDFFIKRALDQYFYALYWGSRFILAGTPSGVTLSPEGAQHGWKSDFQIPGQIVFEPYFCIEVDWILTSALFRFAADQDKNRSGVLIRAVTRGADQKKFLYYLKTQARFKKDLDQRKLCPKNMPLANAVDEAEVSALSDQEILNQTRKEVLKGAYLLIDYRGYADYRPKENVVHIFAMGALGAEACLASEKLLEKGVYANVIIVTSPDLLLGALAHKNNYQYLKSELNLDFEAEIISVHDGEPGLLDNIGSIAGKKQTALAVRKHSLCGTPADINAYHGLDEDSIVKTALQALA